MENSEEIYFWNPKDVYIQYRPLEHLKCPINIVPREVYERLVKYNTPYTDIIVFWKVKKLKKH